MREEEWAIRALHWDEEDGSYKAKDADTGNNHLVLLYILAFSGDRAGNDHSIAPKGELSFGTGGRLGSIRYIYDWCQLHKARSLILSHARSREPRLSASSFLADLRTEVIFQDKSDSCLDYEIENAPWQLETSSTARDWIEIFKNNAQQTKVDFRIRSLRGVQKLSPPLLLVLRQVLPLFLFLTDVLT